MSCSGESGSGIAMSSGPSGYPSTRSPATLPASVVTVRGGFAPSTSVTVRDRGSRSDIPFSGISVLGAAEICAGAPETD